MKTKHLLLAMAVSGSYLDCANPAFAQDWTLTSAPFTNWTAVASSADGSRLVAVAGGGAIYTSSDSGATWAPVGTPVPIRGWDGVASSADGRQLLALAGFGPVYLATNSDMLWMASSANTFYGQCAASSADGSRLLVGNYDWPHGNGGLLASMDSGASWKTVNGLLAVSIACSADGTKLVEARRTLI